MGTATTTATATPNTAKTVPPVTAKTVPLVPSTASSDFVVQHQQQHHSFHPATIAFGMLGVVFAMLLLVGFCANARRRRRMNKRKHSVYEIISKFDVEDVRLDKSATGGWHGTYQSDHILVDRDHVYLDDVDIANIEESFDFLEGGNTVTNSVDTTLNYPIRYGGDDIDDDDSSDDDGSGGDDNDLFSSVQFGGSENTHDII